MDYKNELNSDDDFDNSNGFSDSYGNNNNNNSSSNNGQTGFGQSQMLNTNGMSKAELRKTNKPIMEKRRRARINHCLNELKSLILEAMKKDPARHTKLEKADILEMTVKHLQSVQRQQLNMAIQTDPSVIHKFKTGFVECAEEVNRYVNQLEGIDTGVRQRLSNHLKNCATSLEQIGSMSNFNNGYRGGAGATQNLLTAGGLFGSLGALGVGLPGVGVGNPITATATITAPTGVGVGTTAASIFPPLAHDLNNNNHSASSNNIGPNMPATPIQMGGVQLIPSRLPSGEFALVMPNNNATNNNTNNNHTSNTNSTTNSNNNNIFGSFTPWSHTSNTNINNSSNLVIQPTVPQPQRLSAFTKPTPQQQQTTTKLNGVIAPTVFQHQPAAALHHHQYTNQQQLQQHQQQQQQLNASHHHHQHHHTNAITNNSPPLSPISSTASISSQGGDDSSLMHTSSDFIASRPTTPPTANNSIGMPVINGNHSFSGVFSTPSSADSSTLSSNTSLSLSTTSSAASSTRSSVHLQQQQVSSTSGGGEAVNAAAATVVPALKRRALHTDDAEAADSSDSSDEPLAKKFAAVAPPTPTPPPTTTTITTAAAMITNIANTELAEELSDEVAGTEKWERETREKESCGSADELKLMQRPELVEDRDNMWRPW